MLPDSLERFTLYREIDSFLKIWFLLFLHEHSQEDQVNRDYVRQITFADAPTLDEVINGLRDAGLVITRDEVLSLRDAPEVRSELDTMAHVYINSTGRQELLRRLYRHTAVPFKRDPSEKKVEYDRDGDIPISRKHLTHSLGQVSRKRRRPASRQKEGFSQECVDRTRMLKDS